MRTISTLFLTLFLLIAVARTSECASGPGTSGGGTFREVAGARPMAVGEAFTSISNDITASGYNPSSLATLDGAQASFFYRTGMADDTFGSFMLGAPGHFGSYGLSVGYFNGGDVELSDGVSQRRVNVQTDLALSLGYAFPIEKMKFGLTGKYLSSRLAGTKTATAYAADVGLQIPIGSHTRFGASVQNLGTELKFVDEGDKLPRTSRTGISMLLPSVHWPVLVMLDGVYDINSSQLTSAFGLEAGLGPLLFRGGYEGSKRQNGFSAGLGIPFSRFSLDYAFGFANQLNAVHLISLSYHFASPKKNDFVSLHQYLEQSNSRVFK